MPALGRDALLAEEIRIRKAADLVVEEAKPVEREDGPEPPAGEGIWTPEAEAEGSGEKLWTPGDDE